MQLSGEASSRPPDRSRAEERTGGAARAERRPQDELEVPPPDIEQASERNHLLRALPRDDYAWLLPHLEAIRLGDGEVLVEHNEPIRVVYFPETVVVAGVNRLADGVGVQAGIVGREGVVGLSVFLDVDAMPGQMVVQVPGGARRMAVDDFAGGAQSRPALRQWLHRYTHAYLAQVSQTAACNRRHEDEQRCARWLLMTHDRVGEDSFPLTPQAMAHMLGVRREEAGDVIARLERRKAVRYEREELRVVDREALERTTCECYEIVRDHFVEVLGAPTVGAV